MVVLGGISAVAFLFHKTATNHHSIVETEKKITTDSKVGTCIQTISINFSRIETLLFSQNWHGS